MKITQVAGGMLVFAIVGCGGGPADAQQDVADAKSAAVADARPAKAAALEPADAAPAIEWGVAACDDYMKKIATCRSFKRDSAVFKALVDKWTKWRDDGKTAELEQGCARATELFKCLDR